MRRCLLGGSPHDPWWYVRARPRRLRPRPAWRHARRPGTAARRDLAWYSQPSHSSDDRRADDREVDLEPGDDGVELERRHGGGVEQIGASPASSIAVGRRPVGSPTRRSGTRGTAGASCRPRRECRSIAAPERRRRGEPGRTARAPTAVRSRRRRSTAPDGRTASRRTLASPDRPSAATGDEVARGRAAGARRRRRCPGCGCASRSTSDLDRSCAGAAMRHRRAAVRCDPRIEPGPSRQHSGVDRLLDARRDGWEFHATMHRRSRPSAMGAERTSPRPSTASHGAVHRDQAVVRGRELAESEARAPPGCSDRSGTGKPDWARPVAAIATIRAQIADSRRFAPRCRGRDGQVTSGACGCRRRRGSSRRSGSCS